MATKLDINSITRDDFRSLLNRYASVAPAKLTNLDVERYDTIPSIVKERKKAGAAYLNKEELVSLVVWKVSHGKFRPSLRKLALENGEDDVETISKEAFTIEDVEKASRKLCSLRGIGPATASLLLSVHDPENIPFFSDELFRWCLWEDKPAFGWDRSIKYNAKEYTELLTHVKQLRERLGTSDRSITAVDCEKVAYVLGESDIDLSMAIEPSNDNDVKPQVHTKDTPLVKRKRAKDEAIKDEENEHQPPPKRSTRKKS